MNYHASLNAAWLSTLNEVMLHGTLVDVRGTRSYELLGHSLEFPMCFGKLTLKERKLSYEFMFREAWWILSGRNELNHLVTHAPSYGKFSDDGIRLSGAYGPKIIDQIRYVVETLRDDPYSRQAVINIWRENPRPSKDIPCTLSVQFIIRDGVMHTIVTMRSSDVWLGLPYDVFTFTMLTCLIALELRMNLRLGTMFHNAGSRHVYFKDEGQVRSIVKQKIHQMNTPVDEIDLQRLLALFSSSPEFVQSLHDASAGKTPKILLKQIPWLQC